MPKPASPPPASRSATFRHFAGGVVGVVLVLLLTGCADDAPHSPTVAIQLARPKRPNVVVFVIDTCRADHCSVTGYERPTTPNMEALARRGARFRNAWSPTCWTAPAHATIFTGLLPTTHGLMTSSRLYLSSGCNTLAEVLQGQGWATGCFTLNSFISSSFGLTQGFDEFGGLFMDPGVAHQSDRAQQLGGDWAIARAAEGRRFFLFINVLEPHAPYNPCEPWRTQFAPDATPEEFEFARLMQMPRSLGWAIGRVPMTDRQLHVVHDAYDGEVASADDSIGVLVRRLEDAGLLDETVFVAMSDHGENLGDHQMFDHIGSLHRSVLHVPLVIRAPGVFDDGRMVDDLVRLEDVFPTILELCNVRPAQPVEGRSLLHDLPGRLAAAAIGPADVARLQMETKYFGSKVDELRSGCRSVCDGTHHLIVYEDGRTELYDVSQDTSELVNLAATRGDVVARLRPHLLPYRQK